MVSRRFSSRTRLDGLAPHVVANHDGYVEAKRLLLQALVAFCVDGVAVLFKMC